MDILKREGRKDIDPRHVEAYLRSETDRGTLDDWSRGKFQQMVPMTIQLIDANPKLAEQLARSYGLRRAQAVDRIVRKKEDDLEIVIRLLTDALKLKGATDAVKEIKKNLAALGFEL